MSQSKDKAQCHSNQTNGCWALQGQTGVDASGPIRSYERNNIWITLSASRFFSTSLCFFSVAVTLPSLSPSLIALSLLHPLFLILLVNPVLGLPLLLCLSHYSNRILLISPLSLLTASPKQGQSCNPFTALPVNRFHPNNPKRLTTGSRYYQGKGEDGRGRMHRGSETRAVEKGGRERRRYKGS